MDYRDTLRAWLGGLAWPTEPVAWSALGFALALLALAHLGPARSMLERVPTRYVVAGLALFAGALSAGYVAYYLRGGPRIIDATSYYLEARALAQGLCSFPVLDPSSSFRGRFLTGAPGGGGLAVIFPPGYPGLLALGMLLGVPMMVGPLIAAALVVMTYALGHELTGQRNVGLLGAAFGVSCVALRYHTADTMAHGWAALLVAIALWSALRQATWAPWIAGLASGWLCATRPISGVVVAVVVGLLVQRRRLLGRYLLALLPGLTLLVLHQHAATGRWLGSSQLAYYALADGPPGCFRYGFGSGTGCLHEHGDFVAALLPEGFGAGAAARVSGRRLYSHLRDAFNGQLWGLLLLPCIFIAGCRKRRFWPVLAIVVGVMLGYVPFYFDGSYPGGGARLYADVLPLEHVLGAVVLWRAGAAAWAVPAALAGFAVQTSVDHLALRAREGGRPMFEERVLALAGVRSGLLFIDTDHGFNLAHRPAELDAAQGLVVARRRGDGYDRALWERLGHPPAFRYRYDPGARDSTPSLSAYHPLPSFRFEGESAWPPLAIEGGWVRPEYLPAPCVSAGRGLTLIPTDVQGISTSIDVAVPADGRYLLVIGWADSRATQVAAELAGIHWAATAGEAGGGCWQMPPRVVELARGSQLLTLHANGDRATLDYVDIRPANPALGLPETPSR